MAQAYDFALDKIGMEIMSYQVHAPQKLYHCVCVCVLSRLGRCQLTSVLFSSSPRFGWTTSTFSKECKCYLGFSCKASQKPGWLQTTAAVTLTSSGRPWARTPRTSGSPPCGGCTREAASTPWSISSSSGEIIANMRRRVSRQGVSFSGLTCTRLSCWRPNSSLSFAGNQRALGQKDDRGSK